MKPIVYLLEEQISGLFAKSISRRVDIECHAYAWDDYSVIHAYTRPTNVHSAGALTGAKFVLLPSGASLHECQATVSELIANQNALEPLLIIFFTIRGAILTHKGFLARGLAGPAECEIRFLPIKSDLYSRSKGLLETDILAGKKVGIVGLGSGGSPIAIELAKAGIGHFVLMDFDRLELSNIARHVCGISDLGRFKTFAVRDAIYQRNPHASIDTFEIDVNVQRDACSSALSIVDLIVCASDNDRSRFFLNEIALKYRKPAIFGRAITRATGGDVLRVRPLEGPCYSCLYSQSVRREGSDDEEISQSRQARSLLPDYTSDADVKAAVQVGLSSDITPISNFMVKMALVELSKGLNSGITTLEEDLVADFYIWANRRDGIYQSWSKLEYNFNKPSILRWYGAKVARDPNCMVCGTRPTSV